MTPARVLAAIVATTCLFFALPLRAAERVAFALVVTNNRSLDLGRPELHYADDDGAKYAELFGMIAPGDRTTLLTEFDRDTERLFPELVDRAKPPTRAAVDAAADRIAAAARDAIAAGKQVDFYFVYAGHGDIDQGKGFVELKDTRFDAEDLASLVRRIPSTHSHVILDSCNSFFLVAARKPGGHAFATPADAAQTLAQRLPNVGVFLSTSAEAEVFEWSEFQSGIFSHAVRSGLAGAADANADGAVSYEELRAFVEIASSAIKNPLYRPKVYARGPGGDATAALIDLNGADATKMRLDPAKRRVTVRDDDELPWVDTYKEEGIEVTLRLPQSRAKRASLEELAVDDRGASVTKRYTMRAGGASNATDLALLALDESTHATRGGGDLFRVLFARPFGPRAMAQFERDEANKPPPVYGVSNEDVERMRLLLREAADGEHAERFAGGVLGFGAAGAALGSAVLFATTPGIDSVNRRLGVGSSLVFGGVMAGGTAVFSFVPTDTERLARSFDDAVRTPQANVARTFALTEQRLQELADRRRHQRRFLTIESGALIAISFSLAAIAYDHREQPAPWILGSATSFVFGTSALAYSLVPDPLERVNALWHDDPSLRALPRVTVGFAPTNHGSIVGLAGTF